MKNISGIAVKAVTAQALVEWYSTTVRARRPARVQIDTPFD